MSRFFGILGVLALSLTLILGTGCGKLVEKAAETAVEKATGVDVNKKDDSVTIKGKDGESVTITSKLPDEFKNFPVPSGFQNKDGGSMSSGGDKLSTATWTGKSTVDKVFEFYGKALPEQGWKETSSFSTGDGAMLTYEKSNDPSQSVILTVSAKSGGEVEIAALLGKQTQKPNPQVLPTRTSGTNLIPVPTITIQQQNPTPAPPKLANASTLPAEMKDLPAPSGYGVVDGSTQRMTSGGQFSWATAKWFGKSSVKDVFDFYQKNLPGKGWTETSASTSTDQADLYYENNKDADLLLYIQIYKTDAGIEVEVQLGK